MEKKILSLVFGILILLLAAGCQPSVRFSNAINNDSTTHKSDIASADVDNSGSNSQNYSNSAKPIYPKKYPSGYYNKYSKQIVKIAENWLGVPYLYGGNTRKGVDCSGYVKNVYSEIGINLPRTSREQFNFTKRTSNPAVGDLVFFKKNNKINHVAIYLGNNTIIHSASKAGVIVQSITGTALEKNFAGYGKAY